MNKLGSFTNYVDSNGGREVHEMYLFQEVEKPEMGFANHKYSYGHDECP